MLQFTHFDLGGMHITFPIAPFLISHEKYNYNQALVNKNVQCLALPLFQEMTPVWGMRTKCTTDTYQFPPMAAFFRVEQPLLIHTRSSPAWKGVKTRYFFVFSRADDKMPRFQLWGGFILSMPCRWCGAWNKGWRWCYCASCRAGWQCSSSFSSEGFPTLLGINPKDWHILHWILLEYSFIKLPLLNPSWYFVDWFILLIEFNQYCTSMTSTRRFLSLRMN